MKILFLKFITTELLYKTIILSAVLLFTSARLMAEVYLTKKEALKIVCGEQPALYDPKEVTENLTEYLSAAGLELADQKLIHFFKCADQSKKAAYALIDAEIGKHLPITYIVGLAAQGEIVSIDLMVYREKYGSGVKSRNFMQQFKGLKSNASFKVGSEIKHVSGATISSKSIARGAKRATMLWEWFYGVPKYNGK